MSIVRHDYHDGATSPFDAIRREDEQGEYWRARELMPLLGYGADWRNFNAAIERAQLTARNTGAQVSTLFVAVNEKSGGRPRADYRLARFACYLTAMNGDPKKIEIARAQEYFAVKTREAELTQPVATDPIEVLRGMVEQLAAARDKAQLALLTATESRDEARLANARLDAIEDQRGWVSGLGYANLHGLRADAQHVAKVGRLAGTIGRAQGLAPAKIPSQMFGEVNGWPPAVWAEAFARLGDREVTS